MNLCYGNNISILKHYFSIINLFSIFSDLYAKLCTELAEKLPEYKDESRTVNFRRILVTKCYDALMEDEKNSLNNTDSISYRQDVYPLKQQQSPPGRETKTTHGIRKSEMLGNVIFIGELFRR